MTTSQRIKKLREMGMNNRQISNLIGYSIPYVSNVKCGNSEPSKKFKRAVSQAYEFITIESYKKARAFQDDAKYFAEETIRLNKVVDELQSKLDAINEIIGK